MNIVVLVKQVPNTTEMNVDKETGTLIRTGVPSIINPDDLAGVEEALKLKDTIGAKVTAITMGPAQSIDMLRELLALGVDDVILLTDKALAGSDTWATSNALSTAIKKLDYDLVIAGRQAIDGDTAQVGPQVAEKLGIPQVTYVCEVIKTDDKKIVVKKALEDCEEIIEVNFPCLITTLNGMNKPRYMHVSKVWDSFNHEIIKWGITDIGIDPLKVGLNQSPTKVKRTFTNVLSKDASIHELSSSDAATMLKNILLEKQFM